MRTGFERSCFKSVYRAQARRRGKRGVLVTTGCRTIVGNGCNSAGGARAGALPHRLHRWALHQQRHHEKLGSKLQGWVNRHENGTSRAKTGKSSWQLPHQICPINQGKKTLKNGPVAPKHHTGLLTDTHVPALLLASVLCPAPVSQ